MSNQTDEQRRQQAERAIREEALRKIAEIKRKQQQQERKKQR